MPVLKLPAVLTLTFDGRTVQLNPDEAGRYSLNVLFRASGAPRNKTPSRWNDRGQVDDLIEKYSTTEFSVLKTNNGGSAATRGVWAIKELIFAYAEWISPDFHKVVLDTFSAAVDGDGEKSVKVAQSAARMDGVEYRKKFVSAVSDSTYGGGREAYRLATNKVYVGLFNKDAASLREGFGLTGRKTPRDLMGDDALDAIKATEALSAIALRNNHANGEVRWERVLDSVLDNVKTALSLSPSKFLDATK